MAKKLVRVSLQFDDGSIQRVTGNAAQRWLDGVNSCCTVSDLHGAPMHHIDWEYTNLDEEVRILRPQAGDIVVIEYFGKAPDPTTENIRDMLPEGAYLVALSPGTDIYTVKHEALFPARKDEEEKE